MAFEQLCMYCFEDRQGADVCPHCGRDARAAVPQIQMLPGSLVYHNRFLIGRALGQDANGIVYGAYDTKKENKLRIREYLPRECAERKNDGSVVPIAGMEDRFERGMKKLKSGVEATEDPAKRHFYFEENGTAYIAQRRNAAAAAAAGKLANQAETKSKKIAIAAGAGVVALVAAVVLLISGLNGAFSPSTDITLTPTVSADNVWMPEISPTPTVMPTEGAPIVDPQINWNDINSTQAPTNRPAANTTAPQPTKQPFTPATVDPGQYNQPQQTQQTQTAQPTKAPETTQEYSEINKNSSSDRIRAAQSRLIELGWLSGSADGKYGKQTRTAVEAFQRYINDNYSPSKKLKVDGSKIDAQTQDWMYRVNAYNPNSQVVPQPTATAAPQPTATPRTVIDEKADSDSISNVQRRLIVLGLLKGEPDGKYGNSTRSAVTAFQKKINELEGFNVLDVTGVVDKLTWQYLDYYAEWWQSQQNPTTDPGVVSPTEIPTPAPEETDIPDVPETTPNVDVDSPVESIRFTQQMLISVGLLPAGSDDGVYGPGTSNAVAAFQQWVNRTLGEDKLSVTGVADSLTLQYLEYAFDNGLKYSKPDATDEPEVPGTPEPYETDAPDLPEDNTQVMPDSDKESIKYMQSLLISVGYLRAGSADGDYGDGTATAVRRFQQKVNEIYGAGTVNEDGRCDAKTLQYLEMFAAQGANIAPTAVPDATEAPMLEVDAPSIRINGSSGTATVTDKNVNFDWNSDDNVKSYDIVVKDASGNTIYEISSWKKTSGFLKSSMFTSGVVYTISVGAKPKDGGATVWASGKFVVESGKATDEPVFETPAPTEGANPDGTFDPENAETPVSNLSVSVNGASSGDDVLTITDDTVNCSWKADGSVKSYTFYLTDENGKEVYSKSDITNSSGSFSTKQLTAGKVYTVSVSAQPENGGDAVWTTARIMVPDNSGASADTSSEQAEEAVQPETASVEAPEVSIGGTAHNVDGIPCITGKSAIFSWMAGGDVAGYKIYLTNESGDTFDYGTTTETSNTVKTSSFAPGEYSIYVGAVPKGSKSDEDIVWTRRKFIIPADEAVAAEENTDAA